VADAADKSNASAGAGALPTPDPPGYFEGESMNRRKAFTVAGQAVGGIAGAVIVLPAVGFAVAPIFDRPEERWESIGPVSRFTADTYKSVVFTLVEGIGEAGKTTAYVRRGDPDTFSSESAGTYIALSTRCAQLHLPLPRWRLRLRGQGDRRPAGAPPRPLPNPGSKRPGSARAPLQRHLPARPRSHPRPGRVHGRDLEPHLSAAALHPSGAVIPR
jgi:hypothetical protein